MVQPNLDPTYALAKDISDAQARIGRLEQADITIAGLHDVTLTSQTQGQALTWDATAKKWVNSTPASTLAGLTDVSLTSPTNAQVLTYNSALSKWINATGGGGGSFTVSATAPSSPTNGAGWYNLSNGLIFFYINDGDSSQWVQDTSIANDAGYDSRITALETFNTVAQPVPVGGTGATSFTSGSYLKGNGTSAVTSQVGIPGSDITGYMSPNYIINGAMDIWQRGTSFTPASGIIVYEADHFFTYRDGSGVVTVSQQTFTPGAAPLAGAAAIEGTNFFRFAQTTAGTGGTTNMICQPIEDVRSLAGQTVTISFWAKADAARTVTPEFIRSYGAGGSAGDVAVAGSAITLTTSWVRYSSTLTLPSLSGKTIGVGSYLQFTLLVASNTVQTIDLWGVQVEQGSVATPFRRNANSIQGELAACQRYYYRWATGGGQYLLAGSGVADGTTSAQVSIQFPVTMRAAVSVTPEYGGSFSLWGSGASVAVTSFATLTTPFMGNQNTIIYALVASGLTNNYGYSLRSMTTNAYLGFSAEL